MTLRRQPRELYRVFSEDEFLRLADWQPCASTAGNAGVATRLSQAGGGPSGKPAIALPAGRPRRLLIGATFATGVVGAITWILATSSYTRLTATRRWQSQGALTVSPASVATAAAVGALHATRPPRPAATPSRRPVGRRDAGSNEHVGTARVTRARPRDPGARLPRAERAPVISAPRATQAHEATSPQVAVPSTAPARPRIASRPAQPADFTFER